MNNKKETLLKLLKFVEEISNQPGNGWFKDELNKIGDANPIVVNSSLINEIYEHCIRLIIKEHAERFYSEFKLIDIKDSLIQDFIRMEKFRRENNFEDFCLAAYQQMESIISNLTKNINLTEYFQQNKDIPALLKFDVNTRTFERRGNPTIGNLIFLTGDNAKINNIISGPINTWFFNHKFRAVLYYYYFAGELRTNSDLFERVYNIGNFLYQGRNLNHRGGIQTQYQRDIIDDLIPNQHKYYFKFLGFLEDFTTSINQNI